MQLSSNTETRTYLHPPVTEAVIEIRVNNALTSSELEKIAKKLKKQYPNSQHHNELGIDLGDIRSSSVGSNVKVSKHQKGFHLSSEDQADIVIIKSQSLIISRLAPYLGWDAILNQFILVWKIWKDIAKTRPLSRIGIRYINRIDVPVDEFNKIEIEDYLTFYPKIPIFSNAPMSNYLMQIVKPTSNPLWSTTITSTNQPSPLINTVSLLLDIDLFRTEEIPFNDDDLRKILAEARILKNDIFQQCITQRTEEIFNS
jgi:uncharacterized protein (TIGR04255 family)